MSRKLKITILLCILGLGWILILIGADILQREPVTFGKLQTAGLVAGIILIVIGTLYYLEVSIPYQPVAEAVTRFLSRTGVIMFALIVLTIAIYLPASPPATPVPPRDPGVFLYTADRMLDGAVPYRDVWDHKPPMIFFIDALGLWLGQGSLWGVWSLDVLSLGGAAIIGFLLLKRVFGKLPAAAVSILWLVTTPLLLQGGNHTESFALPFQFIALYAFQHLEHEERNSPLNGLLLGSTGAIAFLLKQNLIGVWLAIGFYFLMDAYFNGRWKRLLTNATAILAGASIVLVPTLAYFASANALTELWQAAFRYNFTYSDTGWSARLNAVAYAWGLLSTSGLPFLALAGWGLGVTLNCGWLHADKELFPLRTPLIRLALIAFPIEILLASLSGRVYPHYFNTLLPVFTVLAGGFIFLLLQQVPAGTCTEQPEMYRSRNALIVITVIALIVSMSGLQVYRIWKDVRDVQLNASTAPPIVQQIQQLTDPDAQLLMWGAESVYNFAAQRPAPTRFVYQYPLLFAPDDVRNAYIQEFTDDLKTNPPALIIDASSTSAGVPPINEDIPDELKPIADFVLRNYEVVTTLNEDWRVFRYRDPQGS